MPRIDDLYTLPPDLVLGTRVNDRVPEADQHRQRLEVVEILARLRRHPGVILADEVGMGKTFVALAVAYTVALRSPRGPVIVMVPANLVDKWEQDLKTFCALYLEDRQAVRQDAEREKASGDRPNGVRYGVARHSVELMRFLDDPPRERCHLIFLAQGAMGRRQTDKWVRLALIAQTLRRHGRGKADRLIQVKGQIHRFLAELLWAIGEERAHDWGDDLWRRLLKTDPETWKGIFNEAIRDEKRRLRDDPVPKSVTRALQRLELRSLADALQQMPIRVSDDSKRVSQRLSVARDALRAVEKDLWGELLAKARWRSPLLVMDEAHHLKNPGTRLARMLQSPESEADLRTGDGAMAGAFDRMLFLTATPFQLGHHELVRVLERFGDVRWDDRELGDRKLFGEQLVHLRDRLDDSQRAGIGLQRAWSRLRLEDLDDDVPVDAWWDRLQQSTRESLTAHQRAVVDAYEAAKRCRVAAQDALGQWIVRHNKGAFWPGTSIGRRRRVDGAAVSELKGSVGLPIPPHQLLPFFLAARSAVKPGQDLLGEALCSSFEAFRFTRENRKAARDDDDEAPEPRPDLSHASWYLAEFDHALKRTSGATHPKMHATVRKVVDLWAKGEKVLVFAFYRHTCRALRIHISQEIDRRVMEGAQQRLRDASQMHDEQEVERLLETIQRRYFDDAKAPGRRAVDAALAEVLHAREAALEASGFDLEQREALTDVMRRFLRVRTTLLRCFPIAELDSVDPADAVGRTMDYTDDSGASWRSKFDRFVDFLTDQCTPDERRLYLEAATRTQTGGIRVEGETEGDPSGTPDAPASTVTLANVQVATGDTERETRSRLMRAFNTPFFPDIFVCSEVMGEGVDLQRFCRHVIHHDLAWNPSTIEQRTGRIDRLGCAAEGRHPIFVYLPYLAGTADERQYRVMSDREQWFRVVMGQDEVARLITPDSAGAAPLPAAITEGLSFKLDALVAAL